MNDGIMVLRELADTLEEESKQVSAMEAELARLRAEVKRLHGAIDPAYVETLPDGTALVMTKAVETEILRLRAENERMREALRAGVELQQKHYGNATNTHLHLSTWAETRGIPALGSSSKPEPETCVWLATDDMGEFKTGCGREHIRCAESPLQDGMIFCVFCGEKIEEKY